MKQLTQAMVLAGVLFALPALPGVASAETALKAAPTLVAQQATGGQEDMTPARRYYLRGVELMNNSRFLDAVEQFQLCIDEDPESVDCHRRLALAYTQMGATEADYYMDAIDVYEDLEAILPEDDVDVRKSIAFVQAAMGDIDDAIATYEEILEITPEDCEIWNQIGAAEKLQADRAKVDSEEGTEDPEYKERIEKALSAYAKVNELCPDSLEAFNIRGEIYFTQDRMAEAAEVYEKMLAKGATDLETTSRLAFIYQKGGQWDKAIATYEKLLEMAPDRLNDRKLYANALQKGGKHAAAAAQFQKIIAADPQGSSNLYCNMCMLYALDAKDAEKAIETAMRGIAENAPVHGCLTYGWGKGLELRGTDLVKHGQYDRAITTYREAKLKFQSILGDANFGGHAQKQLGRLDQLIDIAEQTREKAKQGGR